METTIWQTYPQDEVLLFGISNTNNSNIIGNFVEENKDQLIKDGLAESLFKIHLNILYPIVFGYDLYLLQHKLKLHYSS